MRELKNGETQEKKYILLTKSYLIDFIEYPDLYESECNFIFGDVCYFDYQLEILYYLKEIEVKHDIDYNLALKMVAIFENLGRGHFNTRNIEKFNGDIRFNINGLEDRLYVSVCWKKYANSIRGDREEFKIPEYNEDGLVKKYSNPYQEMMAEKKHETNKNGACYIATCVYGSYDCKEVWRLRRYRDFYLENHWFGRAFIKVYYFISPKLVKLFGNQKWFKNISKKLLDKKISKLIDKGYLDTPYNDKC